MLFAALTVLFVFNGCSIKKLAMNQVANALTGPGSGTVFTGDNDPELVGDALPFTIKMYESLLASIPNHQGLQLSTGSLCVMYANAFLYTPASMMTDERMDEQEFLMQRAKNLYLRGRDILLDGLDKKYPGFKSKLNKRKFKEAAGLAQKKDIEHLYWAGAGWVGAFAIDPFDMKLGITLPGAAALMERALELNPNYGKGDIHNFYVLYYGSMPDYMGGSYEKARKHFKLAVKASGGKATSPYLSLATTVSVQDQNIEEFKGLLKKVLEVDPDSDPENRLLNILNLRKARWLMEHIDDFFVPELPEEETEGTENTEETQ
jgi:predicted anti-sigma-YlaC factor YlaD